MAGNTRLTSETWISRWLPDARRGGSGQRRGIPLLHPPYLAAFTNHRRRRKGRRSGICGVRASGSGTRRSRWSAPVGFPGTVLMTCPART